MRSDSCRPCGRYGEGCFIRLVDAAIVVCRSQIRGFELDRIRLVNRSGTLRRPHMRPVSEAVASESAVDLLQALGADHG
jgi:hypothetical protein